MSQMALLPGEGARSSELFPSGKYDVNGQQVDLRKSNSWMLKLDQVRVVFFLIIVWCFVFVRSCDRRDEYLHTTHINTSIYLSTR
jgi:hypothetical protein